MDKLQSSGFISESGGQNNIDFCDWALFGAYWLDDRIPRQAHLYFNWIGIYAVGDMIAYCCSHVPTQSTSTQVLGHKVEVLSWSN